MGFGQFCINVLEDYPISTFITGAPANIGIVMFIFGITNICMSWLTIGFIKTQEFVAQGWVVGDNSFSVRSVIFPIFVNVLWFSAFGSVYSAIVVSLVPLASGESNTVTASILYGLMWALQHGVIEGIAFLLIQKGCGVHATKKAIRFTAVWSAITFIMFVIIFRENGTLFGQLFELLFDLSLLIFYGCLWFLPQPSFFRRPAAINYAKFWFYYRVITIFINILFFFSDTITWAACGYIFASLGLFALFQPVVCYWTLLQDSRLVVGYFIQSDRS
jgi:hypothetical protein